QAEDGIRDRNVTGVQTCALPIYLMNVLIEVSGEQTEEIGALSVREHGLSWVIIQYDLEIHRIPKTDEMIKVKTFAREYNRIFSRSEERRVGKECMILV